MIDKDISYECNLWFENPITKKHFQAACIVYKDGTVIRVDTGTQWKFRVSRISSLEDSEHE